MNTDKAKILLIAPPYASLRGLIPTPVSHLGLLYLAAFLRRHEYEVKVFLSDMWTDVKPKFMPSMKSYLKGWSDYRKYIAGSKSHEIWNTIESTVREYQPDVVGITSTSPEIDSTYKVASIIKNVRADIYTVMGGPHATLLPDRAMNDDFDFLVRGEGELPLLKLVQEISEQTCSWQAVPSLSYKATDGSQIDNDRGTPIKDLDALPFPARDLIIAPEGYQLNGHSVIGTRGCPYRCSFCADREIWGQIRRRSAKNVADEIEAILSQDPQTNKVYFSDGTLTFDKPFLHDLCSEIVERKLDCQLYCTARFDNINAQMLAEMKNAGFAGLYLGAESGDPDILMDMNKGITIETIKSKLEMVRESGISSLVSILVGVPGESEKSLKNTIGLMQTCKADFFDVNSFVPLPGCKWYDELDKDVREGIKWVDYCYKGGYPFLFAIEGKEKLNPYIDRIYTVADRRQMFSMARLIIPEFFKAIGRRLVPRRAKPNVTGSSG